MAVDINLLIQLASYISVVCHIVKFIRAKEKFDLDRIRTWHIKIRSPFHQNTNRQICVQVV